MIDTTELFNGWIGEEIMAYVLRSGGPPRVRCGRARAGTSPTR